MKFSELYKNKETPAISFEIFPPKTANGIENLKSVLRELSTLSPDFISVTYGAMGTTRDKTIDISNYIKNQLKIETACHLTCVGADRKEIDLFLTKVMTHGIDNIVALRGDPPAGEKNFISPPDGYTYANELVHHIRGFEKRNTKFNIDFGIAIAGYPEKHLEAPNFEIDLENLKRKVDAGADIIITQLFFDNQHYYNYVKKVMEVGIDIPIIPGLMPILSAKQIMKITNMCGTNFPEKLKNKLENSADNDAYAEELGIKQCIMQAKDLLENGVPGIHFYVLNKSAHIKRILSSIT